LCLQSDSALVGGDEKYLRQGQRIPDAALVTGPAGNDWQRLYETRLFDFEVVG